jgi:hypothetical protein
MEKQNGERIDLNTAGVRDLRAIPGVDRLMARRIVFERKLHGDFMSAEDLARVEGASADFIAHLSQYVSAEPGPFPHSRGRIGFVQPEGGETAELAFWGTPEFLRGTVPLRNEGGATFNGVSLGVEGSELRSLHGERLERLQAVFSIGAGQSAHVPATIQLDATTPPGVYRVEIVAGADRRAASLHVLERTFASLAPSQLVISNAPGAKTDRQVSIRNEGNVPITISDVGAVPVEDRDFACRAIRDAVKRLDNPNWDRFVGAVSEELKKSFALIEPMRIRTKNKPVTVQPGETAILDLEIQNPKNTRKGRFYVATARVFNTILSLDLVPASAEDEG